MKDSIEPSSIRVLVVDDDPVVADALGEILRRDGYRVKVEIDAESGLGHIVNGDFDAVLLDIAMPKCNGVELARRALEEKPDLIVIFVTGFGNLETARQAVRLGAYDYILKPFTRTAVSGAMREALARASRAPADECDRRSEASDEGTGNAPACRLTGEYAGCIGARHALDLAVSAAQSPAEVVGIALQHIWRLVPCEEALVVLFGFDGYESLLLGRSTKHRDMLKLDRGLAESYLSLAELLHDGQVTRIDDTLALAKPLPAVQTLIAGGVRSLMAIPLISSGKLIGALCIGAYCPGAFKPQHVSMSQEIALSLAIAIEQSRLHEAVRSGHERLQTLSHRLVEVAEAERRYIARELHDEVGQVLTGLKLTLEIGEHLPANAMRANVSEAKVMVSQLLKTVRDLSLNLRPPILDDLGLLPALLWHIERYTAQTGIQVSFSHSRLRSRRFAPEIETAAFRIVQEGLTNIARHAKVNKARVRIWTDVDILGLSIEDHGVGFDAQAVLSSGTTVGLIGICERASCLGGRAMIESTPGAGTLLTVELPDCEEEAQRLRSEG